MLLLWWNWENGLGKFSKMKQMGADFVFGLTGKNIADLLDICADLNF